MIRLIHKWDVFNGDRSNTYANGELLLNRKWPGPDERRCYDLYFAILGPTARDLAIVVSTECEETM